MLMQSRCVYYVCHLSLEHYRANIYYSVLKTDGIVINFALLDR